MGQIRSQKKTRNCFGLTRRERKKLHLVNCSTNFFKLNNGFSLLVIHLTKISIENVYVLFSVELVR